MRNIWLKIIVYNKIRKVYIKKKVRMRKSLTLPPGRPILKSAEKSERSSRRLTSRQNQLPRSTKIRQKNMVYPLSTRDKIVFISNRYGIGFKNEKLEDLDCPAHIQAEEMLREINEACYDQWKAQCQQAERKPFQKLDLLLGGVLCVMVLLAVAYFFLISGQQMTVFQLFNLFFCLIIALVAVLAFYVCLSRREKEPNLDEKMVEVIKQKLVEFNSREQEFFGDKFRFKWTCHRDCLWIALNL